MDRMSTFAIAPVRKTFRSQTFPSIPGFLLTIFFLVQTVAADTNALTMISAVSRKNHGRAGAFDLPLNLGPANNATVEPRRGGPTTILFTFSDNITTVDGTLGATNFTIANATFSSAAIASNALTLNLTAIPDTSLVLVSLNGITDLAGSALTGTDNVAVRALYGNAYRNGLITLSDLQSIKNCLGRSLSTTNFLCDLDLSGSINLADMQVAKNNLAHGIRSIPVVMTLALDQSGSMLGNGGSTALPVAVTSFIHFFDDTTDRVAQISFASTANVNVAMQQPFKSAITNAVSSLTFGGATYIDGALQLAQTQNQGVSIPANQNVVKAVVFFTDGYPNIFQFTWTNRSHQIETYNVGGYDTGNAYSIFNPTNGNQIAPPQQSNPLTGPVTSKGVPYDMPSSVFVSIDGTTKAINAANFYDEAQLRTVATADAVRSMTNFIYCVGLPYGGPAQTALLQIIANDPALLVNTNLPAPFITAQHTNLASYFNPSQPVGEAIIATSASDLKQLLQVIVARILSQ